MMKKRIFLAMSAVVMLAMGVCGCSNDDDKIVLWDDSPQLVYEDNPTTIDGVWCLVHFSNGWGSLKDYNAGELALKIDEAHYFTCGCNFCEGCLLFDDGMACDSPGYFFKKLKTVFELY